MGNPLDKRARYFYQDQEVAIYSTFGDTKVYVIFLDEWKEDLAGNLPARHAAEFTVLLDVSDITVEEALAERGI